MSYKWPGIPNGDYSFDHGRAVWNKIINYLRRLSEKLDSDIVDATADRRGMMTAADKDKLDGVEPGAEVNQHAFSGVKVGSSTIEADAKTDVLELGAGTNISLTVDTTNDKVTITNTYEHPTYTARTGKPTQDLTPGFGDTVTISQIVSDGTGHVTAANDKTITIPSTEASQSTAGLMSATDKTKLDGIASGAEVNQNAFSNIQVGPAIVAADSKTDTLTLGPGAGVIIISNTTNDSINIVCVEATQSVPGIMSTADKIKLDGIASGAEVNQNAFSNIKVGSTTVAADAKTDTFELVAGNNVTITPDATNDKITIAATDTTYSNATTSAAGLMSKDDKTKLNGIATGAEVNQNAFSNVKVGSTTVAADSKTDTLELEAGTGITLTPDATNDKVTIKVTDNTYAAASHSHNDYVLKTGDTMTGMLVVPAIRSQSSGNVKTKATGGYTGLVIKDASASADSTPNNGMVVEIYKNNSSYAGQLFLGDNASQGLYWNGWSSGTYGVWKKFIMTSDATYTVGSATKPVYVNDGAVAACTYELNASVPANAKFTDTVTTVSESGSGNAVTSITASNGALTVKKDNTFLLSNANAVSASKLQTARTLSLGNQFQGSASFDGSSDITIDGIPYCATIAIGNRNNFPYHYIGTTGVLTGTYVERTLTLLITVGHNYDCCGICRIKIRTAVSGTNSSCSVRWIVRDSNMPVDLIQIGFRNVFGSTIADIFYKASGAYQSGKVQILEAGYATGWNRSFTLNASSEANDTTTANKGSSYYSYASLTEAQNTLHSSQPYTHTIVASDKGMVNVANKIGTSTIGSATKPVYVSNGTITACKNDAYYPSNTDISLDGVSLGYVTASQKEVQFLFPLAMLAPGSVKSCSITSVTMHTVNGTKTFSAGFTVSYAQLWTATGVIIRLVFTASTGISNNTPLTIACSGNLQFN